MTIGYNSSGSSRQPVYGEQVRQRVGFVEREGESIYFCDNGGRRIAKILRYKPHQAPQPMVSLCASTIIVPFSSC